MLTIVIPSSEFFNEETSEFITLPETHLNLEHSLLSISKWESKWHKAFLKDNNKTKEEMNDYIKCMTLNKNINPYVYYALTSKNLNDIANYMKDKHTAVFLNNEGEKMLGGRTKDGDVLTSDLIYYMMITLRIPLEECQKWHVNRLLTLIHICNIKNSKKNHNKKSILSSNASLNAARRKKYGTRG